MKTKWLVEDFERDNSFGELAEEIKRQGMVVETIRYEPFESGSINRFEDIDCVAFQGSINLARQIQRQKPGWIPGPWCSWENYACTMYYAHWGKYLINNDYMMMPLAEIQRRKEELLKRYNGMFFVRPDTGAKLFTGMVLDEKGYDSPLWKFNVSQASPNDLVLVAEPKNIHKEWRVICTKGEVITGSRYKTWNQVDYKAELPKEVEALAKEICSTSFQPDPIYVLDICDWKGNLYLLEIGAFSVAGLYKCELPKLVEVASQLALDEWRDINPPCEHCDPDL